VAATLKGGVPVQLAFFSGDFAGCGPNSARRLPLRLLNLFAMKGQF
jgi:hypothetical protein